jgi:WD40 repeat protein
LLTVLDEEVQRLPTAQRSTVVLCCLEGHPQEEAARMLGCTAGSLKGHLERGRKRRHARLTRRGIALSAALALVAVSRGEVVSALLRQSAMCAALGGAGGSPLAVALAASVLKGTFAAKLAGVTALVLTMALGASVVALVYRTPARLPDDKPPAAPAAPKKADADKPERRVDALGDPLPAGAIARLGTVRFRAGDEIKRLTFTPDGKRLVTQGYGGVSVWDAATGKELHHLASKKGRDLGHGDLSPDGKLLAVWGHVPQNPNELCSIELWDMDSDKKVGSLEVKCNISPIYFRPIRFSPDGKLLATSSIITDVHIWDLTTRKELRSWQAHPMDVWNIAFSPDSRNLITCGSTGEFRLWNVATGRQLQEFKPLDWKGYSTETETALSPDGKLLALMESNEKRVPAPGKVEWKARISLRDTATGKPVRQLVCPAYDIFPGSRASQPFRALMFTSDGKGLITSGPDHFVRIWDPNSGKELRRMPLEEPPASLALSPDGKKLAVVMWGGTAIRVLDMTSGQALMPPGGHLRVVSLAILSADGRTAVTGSPLGSLSVWDASSGRMRRRLKGHDYGVLASRLGSDGWTLFTLGWDRTLRVWDLAAATERRRITVEHDHGRLQRDELSLTPDGKTLAVIDRGKTIRILDVASGEERQHFPEPEELLGLRLTPDGRSLIAWSGDLKVRVWDTGSGRKLREYSLPRAGEEDGSRAVNERYNAALSPDGRLLAMGPVDHRIPRNVEEASKPKKDSLILKDLATGRIVRRIDNLPSEAGLLAFSPDGRMLAWTGFKDNAIRVLEVASGRERRRLAGHRGQISALAFSANGRRLLSGSNDTTALVWDLAGRWPATLTAAEVEALWADLAGADAARAYRAIHKLAAAPEVSVPFLRKRLRPIPVVDEKRVARLIADLDSDDFATRQKATTELAKLADQPITAYRKALESKPSIETCKRLEELLEKAGPAWWDVSGERLRSLRAVEALEMAGTKEARDTLATIEDGASGARFTEQAKAALERLTTGQR